MLYLYTVMYFQVPQFIDIEDKIFGPLTFKQFLYLLGGAAITFVLIKLLPTFIAILLSLPFIGLSLALAFYKVNNRPFIQIMQSWFSYLTTTRLYTWKVRRPEDKKVEDKKEDEPLNYVPKISDSKLKDISWSLDVLDSEKK